MISVEWGEMLITRGYYIYRVEMREHIPPNMFNSRKGGSLRPIPRRGAVSPINVPPKNTKRVCVLGMGCGHLASAS